MIIRDVTEGDFKYLFGFVERLWTYNKYEKKPVHKVLAEILDDANSFVYILEDDGPKGFIHGSIFNTFWMTGKTCYIGSLYVDETERKKGYGKALIEFIKEYAKENGCKAIILDSGLPRTGAHAFYENIGFEKSCYGFEMELIPDV